MQGKTVHSQPFGIGESRVRVAVDVTMRNIYDRVHMRVAEARSPDKQALVIVENEKACLAS